MDERRNDIQCDTKSGVQRCRQGGGRSVEEFESEGVSE